MHSFVKYGITAFSLCLSLPSHAGFWDDIASQSGLDQTLASSPLHRSVAISAHNAYTESYSSASQNLSSTLQKLISAISANADLLELDLVYDASQQTVKISHNPSAYHGYAAVLDDVLGNNTLRNASQPMFLELKEQALDTDYVEGIIDSLANWGYLTQGRPVFLRSFPAGRDNLVYAQQYLASHYPAQAQSVYFSELYSNTSNLSGLQAQVAQAQASNFDMVEFNYQTPNLGAQLAYARSLGLGVGLWTIPASMGEVGLTLFRNEVDEITTDYDLTDARQVVEDTNELIYFNMNGQDTGDNTVTYYRQGITPYTLPVGGTSSPSIVTGVVGQSLFGTLANFDSSQQDKLSFYDADQNSENGYLVNVLVRFNDLSIPDGATRAIVNKADSAGFAMELYNPAGTGGTVLRYGVHVDGAYSYATYDASQLNETNSYYITGAYDGDGGVRLYINSKQISAGSSFSSGVDQNNSPVVLAADPQGATNTRFHADIDVQMLSVQDWHNH